MENLENEIWKYVVGYEGYYEVSSLGRVKSLDNVLITKSGVIKPRFGRLLRLTKKNNGYMSVMFSLKGIQKRFHVHRLVAISFIPNPENKPQVNHINANRVDNRLFNLEWCTSVENCKHSSDNSLRAKGENLSYSKLKDIQVIAIRRLYKINPFFNKLELSKKLGISDSVIHNIIRRKSWKHI